MSKILVIAGHGKNKNGSFDPGANGYISKGEHKYYVENFFPAVTKFLPDNSNVILFSDYNVYDHKNLVSLANSYGKDTIVVEMHYDAASEAASGGHVIVHADYEPDALDLKLRDVIKKHIGIRYNHKGHQGISGRSNLGNCNRAKNGNINYRLIELGFGTNKKDADIMVNNVEAIAKDFVEALVGKSKEVAIKTPNNNPTKHIVEKGDTLWSLAKKYDTTVERLKSLNNLKNDLIVVGDTLNLSEKGNKVVSKPVAKVTSKKYDLPNAEYWVKKPQFSGSGVRTVQEALSSIYFYPNKGAKNNGVDGYYGPNTADAVKRFQSMHGLDIDGIYGAGTRKKLDSLVN